MAEVDPVVQASDLPMVFQVKYLGQQPSRGLWGIKHTRKPVDDLVTRAKAMSAERGVPRASLTISREGVSVTALLATSEQQLTTSTPVSSTAAEFPIEHVSYGVQDLVYTRVFSMIVVRDAARDPFECHAFVCSSRAEARRLTYALAAAFHEYSASLKDQEEPPQRPPVPQKRFAIDLRTPEELAGAIEQETDA